MMIIEKATGMYLDEYLKANIFDAGGAFITVRGAIQASALFRSTIPTRGFISVLVSNYGDNVWAEMRKLREILY